MDRLLPAIVEAARDVCTRAGSWRATIRVCAALEGLEQTVEVLHGRRARDDRDRPSRHHATRSTWARSEDRTVSGSAGEPEAAARYARGRVLDCFQLQRRLRADAGAAMPRDHRDRHLGGRGRPNRRERAAQRRRECRRARGGNVFDELRGLERRGERFDTIVLDPPAFAKNKAAVREGASPATRKSTCGH